MRARHSDFFEYWTPRLGENGAETLKKISFWVLLIFPFLTLGLGGAAGFSFYAQQIVLGILFCLIYLFAIGHWIHLQMQLAKIITQKYGFRTSWTQLPVMKEQRFDNWLRWKKSGKKPKRWGLIRYDKD